MSHHFPEIRDLAIIGDQQTAAIVTKKGEIVWYCPYNFDAPSLLASLLDNDKGIWKFESDNLEFASRKYLDESGILETKLKSRNGNYTITDWMPYGDNLPAQGIVRNIETHYDSLKLVLTPAPDYGRSKCDIYEIIDGPYCLVGNVDEFYIYASHPIQLVNYSFEMTIPANEKGWMFLSNAKIDELNKNVLEDWYEITVNEWKNIAKHFSYSGIYEKEIKDSIRAIRLLTNKSNGGIIAAATTSLPEVVGGERNYDYRYVWLRDTGMITSAITRAGSSGFEGRKFLDFICDTSHQITDFFLKPLFAIGKYKVRDEVYLNFKGYKNSTPVRIGNNANEQLQLDSLGNVLLAAKLIYQKTTDRDHWDLMEKIADFLVEHWQEADYGLWEESKVHQYTTSKVIVCVALMYISDSQTNQEKKELWLKTSEEIRKYIHDKCLTTKGAYAVYAGSEQVDISAVLYPIWGFIDADTPEMLNTFDIIEKHYKRGNLYWRHLDDFDSEKEGSFLAATLWVAQYYIMRNNATKAKAIIDECLKYANDLGLFAEEADPNVGTMLGNFPQSFVHAALIGAVIDLNILLERC